MLTIITLLLSAALLTALLAYYYQKAAFEKKSHQQAKQALLKRSNQIKTSFKQNLERITASGALCPKSESAIYRIANYYFVFQSVNSQTVEHFSQLTKDLVHAIDDIIDNNQSKDNQTIKQQLERFAASLPHAAGGYTANFYRSDLPVLIFHLKQDPKSEPLQASDTPSEETQMAS